MGFAAEIRAHRWVRVVVYGLAVTLTSCLYAGWQQYSLILIRGGKYSWKCGGEQSLNEIDRGAWVCPEQEQAIGSLFPLVAALELAGAVFAGVALDQYGPRTTATAGEIMGVISTLMMVFSTQKRNMLTASMIITGIAINLIAFPALILEDFFPSAAATSAAYVVSCQALSSLVAPIIWALWRRNPQWTFDGIWLFYLAFLWIPFAMVYIFCLPGRRTPVPKEEEDLCDEELLAALSCPTYHTLLTLALSPEFIIMNIINIILMLQTAYYQVVVRSVSGIGVADFIGWGMPTASISGLLLGRLVDYIKTPAMMLMLLCGFGMTYSLMLVHQPNVEYLAATIFLISMSYAFTVKYSYVQETFPASYYGRLVGIAGGLSGCCILLTNVLTATMTVPFWCIVLMWGSVLALPMVAYLWWCASRRERKSLLSIEGNLMMMGDSVVGLSTQEEKVLI